MSITMLSSNPYKMHKNPSHRRNNSGELDIFEAAEYFSGATENPGPAQFISRPKVNPGCNIVFSQELTREDYHELHGQRACTARMSLDMPMRINAIYPQNHHSMMDQKETSYKDQKKKYKLPSSPGGRLASFLNSLFNQTASKSKKKSKPGVLGSSKDLDQGASVAGERMKRRFSISHFRITTNSINDSKKTAFGSSSFSGSKTRPPYADTPTKSYEEFKNFSEQEKHKDYENISGRPGLHGQKSRFNNGLSRNTMFRYLDDDDDDDSDSSSDLFDLPNHEFDFYSSSGGLPVYETTHIDRIRINAV